MSRKKIAKYPAAARHRRARAKSRLSKFQVYYERIVVFGGAAIVAMLGGLL
jgi:hypothetical protein